MSVEQEISKLRRRRGVVPFSVTRLKGKVSEFEKAEDRTAIISHAREISSRLESLNSEFQMYHLKLIDLIDDDVLSKDECLLEKEQRVLDEHDDQVTDVKIRLEKLFADASPIVQSMIPATMALSYFTPPFMNDNQKLSQRKVSRLQRVINELKTTIYKSLLKDTDIALFEQYVSQYKSELSETLQLLLTLEETSEVEEMTSLQSRLEQMIFECLHAVRNMLKSCAETADATLTTTTIDHFVGVRLPKLNIPTFDGNLLSWRQFWEQFCISVHDRPHLSNAEKLAYLAMRSQGWLSQVSN